MTTDAIPFDRFASVEIRVGTVTRAEPNERARKPSLKVWGDFGPGIGVMQTSAQIAALYDPAALAGRQVFGCVNLGPRNIAGFESQFLLLGVPDSEGRVVLAAPERPVPAGGRMF